MFVTVDRRGGREVDAAFESELREHLERFRLAGHDLEIDPPRYVSLEIVLGVCVKAGFFPGHVQQALLEAFASTELPDGSRGFFHPDNFTFGQPVFLSRIIAMAMSVPGVQWVELSVDNPAHRFQRRGEATADEIARGRIDLARLEIARLENDPNAPENGRIEFLMGGGA